MAQCISEPLLLLLTVGVLCDQRVVLAPQLMELGHHRDDLLLPLVRGVGHHLVDIEFFN